MSNETAEEPYNAADPEQVSKARGKAKTRSVILAGQTRMVMSTPEGRDWMWDLLSDCGLYRQPFAAEANQTAFNCGMLNVGQMVLAKIMRECPELYVIMQKEHPNG